MGPPLRAVDQLRPGLISLTVATCAQPARASAVQREKSEDGRLMVIVQATGSMTMRTAV